MRTTSFLLLTGLLLAGATAQACDQHQTTMKASLESAQALSVEKELPILIKVGTSWCSACKAFDKAVAENEGFRSGIEGQAILVQVDAEQGEGVQVAKSYGVHAFPTFILTNARGETIDRWMGYAKEEKLLETLSAATSDPTTVDEKVARFREKPSEADARKLGDLRVQEGLHAEAVAYFRRAAALAPGSETSYDTRIFSAMARGSKDGVFTFADVCAQADAIFASATTKPQDMLEVVYAIRPAAEAAGDPASYVKYLKATVESTDEADFAGEKMVTQRKKLLADYALHVKKNEAEAVSYAKAALPADWMERANMLNNFAWWCFENKINLDEAEQMARRGIELAKPGNEKANIHDTLAEICNLKGDCGDAVEHMRLAVAEDPGTPYFQKQLARFEELLAAQTER